MNNQQYKYDDGELEAITNALRLINVELSEVLPKEEVDQIQHSPYETAMAALGFIKKAKIIRAQDLGIDKPEVMQ